MKTIVFVFESERKARIAVKKLWTSGVTGELAFKPIGDKKFRVEVTPEKPIDDDILAPYADNLVEED